MQILPKFSNLFFIFFCLLIFGWNATGMFLWDSPSRIYQSMEMFGTIELHLCAYWWDDADINLTLWLICQHVQLGGGGGVVKHTV